MQCVSTELLVGAQHCMTAHCSLSIQLYVLLKASIASIVLQTLRLFDIIRMHPGLIVLVLLCLAINHY
jgi:hypothetical protein